MCAVLVLSGLMLFGGCALWPEKPAWELPPPPPDEGPIGASQDLKRVILANGLTVMVLEDHRLPSLSIGLTLRRGAGSVDPKQAGVAEVTSEVMQRGAGDRDALQLASVVEDAGASLSVAVGWDSTSVSISGLSEDRALFLEILEDVALRPRFDPSEFDKALAEQQAALVAAHDDPATLVGWNAMRALYSEHRYGSPSSGTPESLEGLTVDAARDYWTTRFVPGNTIFWAVGDLSADDMVAEARRRFGAMPDGPVPAETPPPPLHTPTQRRIVVVDKPDLGQARIIVAHEGISRTEPTRIAVDLMNDALGGSGFSSRLMQSVRADAGLTYGVGSGYSLRRRPGPFSISTFTRVAEVRTVVDLLLAEMQAIRGQRPIDEAELEKFISYNVGRFGLSLETPSAVLWALIDLDVYGLPEDSLDTYRSRVRAVRLEDVSEAARQHLFPDRAAIIVLGPASDLVPQLEALGPVEVWQP
jgi:zinc protease